MVLQSPYCFGDTLSTTVEISQDTPAFFLPQIEAELYDSEIYQRAMAGLQTMLGGAIDTAQILVKAVGREAIRLAFQQFTKHNKEAVPVVAQALGAAKEERPPSPVLEATPDLNPNNIEANAVEDISSNLEDAQKTSSDTIEVPELTTSQQWKQRLREIGERLHQVREAHLPSVEELHEQTLVPHRHIQALEAGDADKLPEDVYVRGFIRHLGKALGLDGEDLAASLPTNDPSNFEIYSWCLNSSVKETTLCLNSSVKETTFNLHSLSSYLGYTALVAGTMGGIGLLSQHVTNVPRSLWDLNFSPQKPVSRAADGTEFQATPGLQLGNKGVTIGADMSPPEVSVESNMRGTLKRDFTNR